MFRRGLFCTIALYAFASLDTTEGGPASDEELANELVLSILETNPDSEVLDELVTDIIEERVRLRSLMKLFAEGHSAHALNIKPSVSAEYHLRLWAGLGCAAGFCLAGATAAINGGLGPLLSPESLSLFMSPVASVFWIYRDMVTLEKWDALSAIKHLHPGQFFKTDENEENFERTLRSATLSQIHRLAYERFEFGAEHLRLFEDRREIPTDIRKMPKVVTAFEYGSSYLLYQRLHRSLTLILRRLFELRRSSKGLEWDSIDTSCRFEIVEFGRYWK